MAKNLNKNDKILKVYEKDLNYYNEQIESIEEIEYKEDFVYNFSVEDNHNYFVNGYLTHNCDDPLNTSMATSDKERENVNDSFGGAFLTRLNDKKEDCAVLIMQRLHENDLTGKLLRDGGWVHLNMPAIADRNYTFYYPNSDKVFKAFKKGEILNPDLEDLETLDRIKRELGSAKFAGQYLQNPFPEGDQIIKLEWFKRYSRLPDRKKLYLSLDTAQKDGIQNDNTAIIVWQQDELENHYIVDIICAKMQYPDLKKKIHNLVEAYKPDALLIEDKASGISLIQDLKREIKAPIFEIKPKANKEVRAQTCTDIVEGGKVFIPTQAHWLDNFLGELQAFPNGSHDDQVDAFSQYLNWHKNKNIVTPRIRSFN